MGMVLHLQALLLKVLLLHFSDLGFLVVQRDQKKWMADHSGEKDLDSETESQTGIGTGIERETEALAVEGVHLVMLGGVGVGIEWMGGSKAGRKTEADGRETETGTETVIETEKEETGGRGEAAWIVTGDEGGLMMARGIEGGGREEKEEGEKAVIENEGGELKEKKGTGQGGQNGGRGPHGGTEMIDWPNWKTWTDFGPLTAWSNLV